MPTPPVCCVDVRAARGDLHFLEHVEVVVDRRRAGGGHVGDVDAVDRPLVVAGAGAARDVAGLLARLVAADVGAVHEDAGRALEHDPRVARRRNVLQRLEVEGRLRAGLARVDERAGAGDRHGFLHRRELQGAVDLGAEADGHADVLERHGAEAGQFERDRVGADRQLRHAVGAGFRRHGHARLNQRGTRDRDGRAWQDGAGVVGGASVDFTGLLLCHGGRSRQNEHQRRRDKRLSQRHFLSSKCRSSSRRGSLHRPSRYSTVRPNCRWCTSQRAAIVPLASGADCTANSAQKRPERDAKHGDELHAIQKTGSAKFNGLNQRSSRSGTVHKVDSSTK